MNLHIWHPLEVWLSRGSDAVQRVECGGGATTAGGKQTTRRPIVGQAWFSRGSGVVQLWFKRESRHLAQSTPLEHVVEELVMHGSSVVQRVSGAADASFAFLACT